MGNEYIEKEENQPKLKKVLSYKAMLLITINAIIGTGIFFLPAVGAFYSGPASIISWIILSTFCIYISMCFAELTSMFPEAGGIYEFCKQAYGHFWSFIIGWTTMIAGNITIAMLVVGAIQYLLPADVSPIIKILSSLSFVFILNYIAYKGMKTSAVMLITFAIITLGTLFALIIPGFLTFNPDNFSPFFVFPMSSIFITLFFIIETFFGWETSTFLAAETIDGEKVVPKVLIHSTIIIAIVCLLFVISSLSTINWESFGISAAPLVDLSIKLYGEIGSNLITIFVYLSIIGSVAGWIVSSPRMILAMAEDKLFLKQLSAVHPKYFTPHKAILFQTIVTTILVIVGVGSYRTLLELLVPVVLLLYAAVILCVIVLRKKMPDKKRYYTAPFGNIGPIITILFLISVLVAWIFTKPDAPQLFKLGFSFILFGIPLFILLKTYYDPAFITISNNFFAYITLLFESLLINKKVRGIVFSHFDNLTDKSILEFGCGVGTLTMTIAERVGRGGKVHAVDLSKKAVEIASKRAQKKGHNHVHFIHDEHSMNQMHPDIPKVDGIISVGIFGYLQNIKKVLTEMVRLLPEDGKVVFVDYVDLFKVIPNVGILAEQDKIINMFREVGLSVTIRKEKGLFWNYLIIYGIKSKEAKVFI